MNATNQQSSAHLIDSAAVGIRTPISTPNSTTMTTAATTTSSSSFHHPRTSSSSSSSSFTQPPPPQHPIPIQTTVQGQGLGQGQGQSSGGDLSSMDMTSFSLTSMLPSGSRPLVNKRLLYHNNNHNHYNYHNYHNNNNNNNNNNNILQQHKPHPYLLPLLPSGGTSNGELGQGGSASSGVRGIAVRGSLVGIVVTNTPYETHPAHSLYHTPTTIYHTTTNNFFIHHFVSSPLPPLGMIRPSSTSMSSAPSTTNHLPHQQQHHQQHHQQQLYHQQQQQQQQFRSKLLHASALLALAGSPSPRPDAAAQSHPSPALSQQPSLPLHSLPLHSPVGSDCYSEGSRGSCKSTGSSRHGSDSNDCSYQSSDGRTDGEAMSVSSAGRGCLTSCSSYQNHITSNITTPYTLKLTTPIFLLHK